MRLADKITFSRIVLAPILCVLYFLPSFRLFDSAAVLCVLWPLLIFAELTDYLDGLAARRRNEVSDFGKLFDPFADVLLHLSMFVCYLADGYMPAFIFVLILYREFGMLFLRLLAIRKGIAIGARKGGKLKTVLYVVCGFFSLFIETLIRFDVSLESSSLAALHTVGTVLYAVACVAAYVSFADYLIQFRKTVYNAEKKA